MDCFVYNPYLNSYVYEQIFEKLDGIETQVRMARAFPIYIDDSLRTWRRHEFTNSLGPNSGMLEHLPDNSDYIYFMNKMAPHFKQFKMFEEGFGIFPKLVNYLMHLRALGIHSLPSVHTCTLNGNPGTIADEDIYDLASIMPNLKVLRVYMGITGEYIERFQNLEELHLCSEYFVLPIKTPIMQSIVLNMKNLKVLDIRGPFRTDLQLDDIQLPNLEVLKVNLKTLMDILPQVMALPRLRKLAVLYMISRNNNTPNERTFEHILKMKAASITGVAINNVSLQLAEDWDATLGQLEFPQLNKIVFENWPHKDPFLSGHKYQKDKIKTIGCSLWQCLRAQQLLHLIKDHRKLKELSITHCYFEKSILKDVERMLVAEAAAYEKSWELQESGRRPRLFIWNFCNFANDLDPAERLYWKENKHIDMELNNYSDFKFQENGFEIDFA